MGLEEEEEITHLSFPSRTMREESRKREWKKIMGDDVTRK